MRLFLALYFFFLLAARNKVCSSSFFFVCLRNKAELSLREKNKQIGILVTPWDRAIIIFLSHLDIYACVCGWEYTFVMK